MATRPLASLQAHLVNLGLPPAPVLTTSDLDQNPIDIYRCYLADILHSLVGCDRDSIYDSLHRTSSASKGDLVFVVPKVRLLSDADPAELCLKLEAEFPESPLVNPPVALGFQLQFTFSAKLLPRLLLPYIRDRKATYGKNPLLGRGKRAIVEFSSPNIAKEFHAGHLRSTIIGAFIANLYETMGWDVVRINYLGDWGKQFALLAVGWARFGSEEALAAEPLKHLLEVYARINTLFKPEKEESERARNEGRDTAEIESRGLFAERDAFFKSMEDGDERALALWERFREISIRRYIDVYARLGIRFDEYTGESQVDPETVGEAETILREKGIYEEHEGSWMIDYTRHGAAHLGRAVVRGRTGVTTYLLRDIAAILERERRYSFDEMLYVVSAEQDVHFRRLITTIKLMGRHDLAAKIRHINFGKVLGMSSRLGNVELLSDILDKCGGAMHEVMRANAVKYAQVEDPDAVADTVGITAVMVQDMSGKRINNYPFDINRMTSFEGDTGPYLQYCHARICSILRKAELTSDDLDKANVDYSYLEGEHCAALLRIMAQYPDVTSSAFRLLEPSTILTYLFRLGHQLSSSYDVIQVVGTPEGPDATVARAALYETARQVLENGMRLLGFSPVQR